MTMDPAMQPEVGRRRIGPRPLRSLTNVVSTAGSALALARAATDLTPARTEPTEDRRGCGPVVLVGGFCAPPVLLEPLRARLGDLGYSVTTHTAGLGLGCGGRSADALCEVVRAAADRAGEPVSLVAHSRGGQFARLVAADPDAPVRRLVTLGTPLDFHSVSIPLFLQAVSVAAVGSLGVPGPATLACPYGGVEEKTVTPADPAATAAVR